MLRTIIPVTRISEGKELIAKQALLRLDLPKGVRYFAPDFKEDVARACNGSSLVGSEFFHYRDGQAISNAEPDIRFVGGRTWVGILSRSGDTDALMPVVGIAARMLNTKFGVPCPVEIEEPRYGMSVTEYPVRYYFRDVVYKKGDEWRGSNEALVEKLLLACICKERDRLCLDLPGDPNGEGRGLEALKERLMINVHDLRDLGMRLRTAAGQTNKFVRLLSGSLTMYAKADGIWQFGSLQSRGHGRLIRQIAGVTQ